MAKKGFIGRVSKSRSRNMAAIKNKNTSQEILLRKYLFALGLKYRIHSPNLPGCPDIVFSKSKVVVFCDGDFWHGRNWKKRKTKGEFKVRNTFWTNKIESNIKRDRKTNYKLRTLGWRVFRFWNKDIEKDPAKIAFQILAEIEK